MNCIGTSEEEYNTVRETKRRPSTNKFVDCGDYIKGITAKGVEYLIDKSDFEKVSKYIMMIKKSTQDLLSSALPHTIFCAIQF